MYQVLEVRRLQEALSRAGSTNEEGLREKELEIETLYEVRQPQHTKLFITFSEGLGGEERGTLPLTPIPTLHVKAVERKEEALESKEAEIQASGEALMASTEVPLPMRVKSSS